MSESGEIRIGQEIGKILGRRYIWCACEVCGKYRWVQSKEGQPTKRRCISCANKETGKRQRGENHPNWKGGRFLDSEDGYVFIRLESNDFFYPMARANGYVAEHRYVMAKKLGRCLQSWELVHHKGVRYDDIRNRSDNLEDNLEMATRGSHAIEHSKGYRDGYVKGLTDGRLKQIEELKQMIEEQGKQIRLLRWERKTTID